MSRWGWAFAGSLTLLLITILVVESILVVDQLFGDVAAFIWMFVLLIIYGTILVRLLMED